MFRTVASANFFQKSLFPTVVVVSRKMRAFRFDKDLIICIRIADFSVQK